MTNKEKLSQDALISEFDPSSPKRIETDPPKVTKPLETEIQSEDLVETVRDFQELEEN